MDEIYREHHGWMQRAACRGAGDVFYEHVWPDDGDLTDAGPRRSPVRSALAKARAICASCPVRAECCELVMDEETGLPTEERYGVVAGLTPRERQRAEGALS